MTEPTVAIIGAGQAGLQLAASLRELRFEGRVALVGDEPHAPYQRPPLSKGYLLGEVNEAQLALRPHAFFTTHRIELVAGKRAVAIDRSRRMVGFDDDSVLAYDHLVLATGARNRPLSVPGAELRNVLFLRTLDEAVLVRERLGSAKRCVVVGAGFIGLEFAASAAKLGLNVTVVDIAHRPMARAVSRSMAAACAREHEKLGVRLLFDTQVMRLLGEHGRVEGVETVDGRRLAADLVIVGIGVLPNVELAANCDLALEDGIVVDEYLKTCDPDISAVGDVAAHVNEFAGGRRLRLESVQNANDQARCVASRLVGRPVSYRALPWFWSNQAHLQLQMAGVRSNECEEVVRSNPNGPSCSVYSFRGEALCCVESLNRPADHMVARRLLTNGVMVTKEQAADRSFDLRSLL